MINFDIMQPSNFWEIILTFLIISYIALRIKQRFLQKRLWLNNFEFWVFYNLWDLYKYNWYFDPTQEALDTINSIKEEIKTWKKKLD